MGTHLPRGGVEGLAVERRGRKSTGRPVKLSKSVEEDLIAENQRLRAEVEYLKNLQALVLERERRQGKKALVVQKLRQKYSLPHLLEIARLPRATFYYHVKRMGQADKYAAAKAKIETIYHENRGRYGYRRITIALRNKGIFLNHKTVQRLMKQMGLVCRVRAKKYRSYKGEVGKIAPNLLNRDFHAEKPNQKWVTDVTEFSLFGEKIYLSPILDLHGGYLVSYTISDRPILSMVTTMLDKAFETIPDGTGLILHSDQGWQYQHKQYQRMLCEKGIRQSMSRKGTVWIMLLWKISLAYSKVSCCICKNLNPWNTSSWN